MQSSGARSNFCFLDPHRLFGLFFDDGRFVYRIDNFHTLRHTPKCGKKSLLAEFGSSPRAIERTPRS